MVFFARGLLPSLAPLSSVCVCVCVCVCVHVCASVCVSVRGVSEVREREYVCKRCVTLGSVCVVV